MIDLASPNLTGGSINKISGRRTPTRKLAGSVSDTKQLRQGGLTLRREGSQVNMTGVMSPDGTDRNLDRQTKETKELLRGQEDEYCSEDSEDKDSSTQKPVALVVDDEILNLDFLQHHLESFGLEVYTAFDGELAIELCHKLLILNKSIDIIFMDYNMPAMNGDECTKKLRDSRVYSILKDTKIVGLTAHRDEHIKAQCLEAGMDMVEYKPFRYEDIEQILLKYNIIASAESYEEPCS
jgi:CheY-like chemotaxis protein